MRLCDAADLYPVCSFHHLREVVSRLQLIPRRSAAAESLVQTHRHLRGNPGAAVDNVGQVLTADPKVCGSVRHAESEWLKAIMADGETGVRWVIHGHGLSLSVIINKVNISHIVAIKAKNDSPVS